ncbi:hypothetical protein [Altererythrobacter sp. Root672]|uniref:hypothetical protein n=1 Tax=Altererythrobacter sp. Root672 TaxID=1736584 RepID=UPI0012E3F2F2|nr:hypothetical protein [Altererythrobacter sp. Root672]
MSIEPPTNSGPHMRHFAAHAEAMLYAEQLAQVTGWPLVDRTGDHPEPPRAA